MSEIPPLDAASLFSELLARFPDVVRVESGEASYRWLSKHAEDLQVHENVELPTNQVVLLDAEGRRVCSVDVTQLRESCPPVYKTLELLNEVGELLEYGFNAGANRYEAVRVGHHAHVVCDSCGRMEDVDLVGTDGSMLAQADAESSFRVWQQRIEFRGICPSCEVAEGVERAAAD